MSATLWIIGSIAVLIIGIISVSLYFAFRPSDDTSYGCTDPAAKNYDKDAKVNDGTCEYDDTGGDDDSGSDTGGDSGSDTGGDDSGSDDETVVGCTDPLASNYDPEANSDNGSCTYKNGCSVSYGSKTYSGKGASNSKACQSLVESMTDINGYTVSGIMNDSSTCRIFVVDPSCNSPSMWLSSDASPSIQQIDVTCSTL